jgi:hypothetical protein
MIGTGIDRFARRTVRVPTHDLIVSPAIADLQFEASTHTWWHLPRAYIGAWRAVVGAWVHDACLSVQRPCWASDIRTIAGLVCLQCGYYAGLLSIATITLNRHGRFAPLHLQLLTALRPTDLALLSVAALAISTIPVLALTLPRVGAGDHPTPAE